MNANIYLSYFGLMVAGATLAATVVRFVRHVAAEREFTRRMAMDEEFRRAVVGRFDGTIGGSRNPIKTDDEFRRHLLSIVDRKSRTLHRTQRKMVSDALHQATEKGRTSYLSKLVYQSAKMLQRSTLLIDR